MYNHQLNDLRAVWLPPITCGFRSAPYTGSMSVSDLQGLEMENFAQREAKITRPHFSFIVLSFGFFVVYNVLSWFPRIDVLHGLRLGDVRLDLALPAAILVLLLWAPLKLMKAAR